MGNSQFGKLLTQGLKSIVALEKTDMTELQHDLGKEIGVSVWTIYKWRKGTTVPHERRTLMLLATACVRRGRMDRDWLSCFLQDTHLENKQALIDTLIPEIETAPSVTHNLPRRYHKKLIGRENELHDVQNFLSGHHRVGVICISGGGGVGKTALALEVAHYYCAEYGNLPSDECFDTIVWVTAKNVELLPAGQSKRQPTFTDLDGVFRAIASLMDIPAIFRTATQAEKNIIMTRLLTEHRVLLMLDNLEEVDDQELMVFLRDLPAPSKAIVTTRHRIDVAIPVHLLELKDTEADELVQLECERHKIILSDEQTEKLLQRTGGLPLAIIRTIGRMAWRSSNIEVEIQKLDDPENETYDFCFGKTVALIKPGDAYQLFMALALFANGGNRDAIGFVAGFGEHIFRRDEGLSDLEVLSLCIKNGDRFDLEPMTRTQALAELQGDLSFAPDARERWIKWYLSLTEKYGGIDRHEWHIHYDHLDHNWDDILATIQWCIDNDRYADVVQLWQHISEFTHSYGYWGDRLNLTAWIIAEAERRGKWSPAVRCLNDRAFTLLLTGLPVNLNEAHDLLQRAWMLRDHGDVIVQARTATLTASVAMRQSNYSESHAWLDTAETLLLEATLDTKTQNRELAAISFDRGENWLMSGNYNKAISAFQAMLKYAETGGSQRGVIYAQNYLALSALYQDDLETAEKLLHIGWPVATRNKEKRIIAFYQRTFAYYYHKLGRCSETRRWASSALEGFQRLAMQPEITEITEMIEKLETA
jgi:hypothetical protein